MVMPVEDCERLVDAWLGQPVNAASSLSFVLVGLWLPLLVRSRSGPPPVLTRAFSAVLILVGIGSFAFHGPGGLIADWLHDGSITALLALIIALELGRRTGWSEGKILIGWSVAAVVLLATELVQPSVGDPLNAPLAVVAVAGVAGRQLIPSGNPGFDHRRKRVFVALGVLGLGAVVMLLSRTGAPLCFPNSLIQGHAIWHVLAAIGVGIYGVAALESDRAPTRSSP